MLNPYESPQTVADTSGKTWWLPTDIGQLVGTYLQALACLSLVSMVAQLALSDQMFIDFSFVFLYGAGVCLKRHNPTVRKWVIGVSAMFVAGFVGFVLFAVIFGTQSMTVNFLASRPKTHVGNVVGVAAAGVLLTGIPLALLMTGQARSEFTRKT